MQFFYRNKCVGVYFILYMINEHILIQTENIYVYMSFHPNDLYPEGFFLT